MPAKNARKVAVLGARFGELNIETEILSPLGVELVEGSGKGEAETLSICKDAEVILCGGSPQIRATLIRGLTRLKAIVRYGIGVDTIDLAEATRRGIYVANVPDYCIEEVATHTMALILSWVRKLPIAQKSTQEGKWDVTPLKPLQSPKDLTLGLVGFGRIAQAIARMARGIGFQVCAADPYVKKKDMLKKRVQPLPLKRLMRSAHFISLHLPLNPKTYHLIGAEMLRLMKPTAYLVNTARGGLVDEKALKEALQEGGIAGAALDVMEEEPWPPGSVLRGLDNLIVTPHSAWYTERSQKELRRKACVEVIRVLEGKVPKNLVNPGVIRYIGSRKNPII